MLSWLFSAPVKCSKCKNAEQSALEVIYWPGLGLSEVQVVDAVEVHVLRVPSEGGLPHAEVHVGGVHPLDHDATLLLHHVQQRVQMPDVPLLYVLEEEPNPPSESIIMIRLKMVRLWVG